MRSNKIAIGITITLVIIIISLGVAFATFSTTLNINGSAEVEASSWDIFFTTENDGAKPTQTTPLPTNNITTSGTATNNSASIVATTFTWDANFKSPGDKIIYTIYVKNGGSYNAKVSNINMPTISCTTDPKNACNQLSYGLYTDTSGQNALSTSFVVDAGDTEVFYLIATLSSNYGGNDGSGLVSTDVTTSTISATVTFEQTGSSSNNGGNSGGESGGSQVANAEYFVGSYYDDELQQNIESWGSLADVSANNMPEGKENVLPAVYAKKVNDVISVCLLHNSTEYCLNPSTTHQEMVQMCSELSSVYDTYDGPEDLNDMEYYEGSSIGCRGSNNGLQFIQEINLHDSYIDYSQDGVYNYCSLSFDGITITCYYN